MKAISGRLTCEKKIVVINYLKDYCLLSSTTIDRMYNKKTVDNNIGVDKSRPS